MFILILICLTSIYSQFPKSNYDNDFEHGYYQISGGSNKILAINENNILFYGNGGSIIKTTDGGNSFTQHFNGTYGRILNLQLIENKLIGVTNHQEIIISNNYGEFWEITKTNSSVSDIVILDDIIYISKFPNDSLMISSDFGNSFQYRKTGIDSIVNLYVYNDILIIRTYQNEFFYYNESTPINWIKIQNSPFRIRKITNKENKLILNDYYNIAILKDDYTWETHYLYDSTDWSKPDFNEFVIYPKDDKLLFFTMLHTDGNGGEVIYNFNEYIISENRFYSIDTLDLIQINGFGNYRLRANNLYISDIIKINDEFYFSLDYDKLIKYKPQQELKIINEKARLEGNQIYDSKNWFAFSEYLSYFLYSEDNGKTFKPSTNFFEVMNRPKFEDSYEIFNLPLTQHIYFKDKENFVIPIKRYYLINERRFASSSFDIHNVILTNDGGKTFLSLREKIREFFYQNGKFLSNNLIPRSHVGNNYLFSETNNSKTDFYLLDENYDFIFASTLDSSEFNYSYFDKFNKLTWIKTQGNYQIQKGDSIITQENTKFYYTKDGINWVKVIDYFGNEETDNFITVSNNGDIYFIFNSDSVDIIKYNIVTKEFNNIKFDSNYKEIYFNEMSNSQYAHQLSNIINIEEDKFYGVWYEKVGDVEARRRDIISFKLNDDDIESIINYKKMPSFGEYYNFVEADGFNCMKNIFAENAHFIPIEVDKYKYYTSINQKDINKELLEVFSFPNPATKGQNINIELDEYAEKVNIYDLLGNEIYSVNQFSNKYEIPTTNLSSGIYMIIIDLGGKRKISKFVVE